MGGNMHSGRDYDRDARRSWKRKDGVPHSAGTTVSAQHHVSRKHLRHVVVHDCIAVQTQNNVLYMYGK